MTHPENVGISSLKLDYGNGQVVTSPVDNSWYCNTAKPASAGSGVHVYPAAGSFKITATVTFETCIGIPGAYVGRPDRPPRPVGPPPGP